MPGRWHVLTVGLIASFMTLLDTSIVNVAFPSIKRDLGASAASLQWVVRLCAGLRAGAGACRPAG